MNAVNREHLILIGLMGCGKSTVGKVLSKKLMLPFLDSDTEIVRMTGVEISTIFEIEGEHAFRDREEAAIADAVQRERAVIATGGGAVLRARNRVQLRSSGTVVYMHASPDTIWQRIRTHRGRPLLASANPLQRLESLYVERDALYRETAHFVVNVTTEPPSAVATKITLATGLETGAEH